MKRVGFIGLLSAVVVAAALRFFSLGAQSLWVDEAGTLLNVCFPQVSIFHFAFFGNNSPPLYFWCVAPFTWLFGPTEFGVRFLSALCGSLSVPLLYFLVLRLGQCGRVFSHEKTPESVAINNLRMQIMNAVNGSRSTKKEEDESFSTTQSQGSFEGTAEEDREEWCNRKERRDRKGDVQEENGCGECRSPALARDAIQESKKIKTSSYFSALMYRLAVFCSFVSIRVNSWVKNLFSKNSDPLGRSSSECGERVVENSSAIALLAAWLLAVNPLHLWFSQEARCYSFLLFLTLSALLLFLRAIEHQRPADWIGFAMVVLAAVSTHLTAPVILMICWGIALLYGSLSACGRSAGGGKQSWKSLAWLSAVSLVAGLLWAAFAFYIRQVSHVIPPARPFSGTELPYTFFAFIGGYSFGPSVRELQLSGIAAVLNNLPQSLLVLLILAIAVITLAVVSYQMIVVKERLRALSFRRLSSVFLWRGVAFGEGGCSPWTAVAVMIAAPLAFSIVIALISSHPYNVRFVLTALAGFLILLAMLLQQMPRRMKFFFGTLLFGVSLWADVQWFIVPRYGKDDLRSAVRVVYELRPDAEKFLAAPGYMDDTLYYYLYRQNRTAQVVPVQDVSAVREHADADIFLLTRPHHVSDPEALIAAFQSANKRRSFQMVELPGVRILLADHRAAATLKSAGVRKKLGCFPSDLAAGSVLEY